MPVGMCYWERRSHLGDVDVDGRIILKWVLKKEDTKLWTQLIWFRIGISGVLL
jgi:hypothetical protein